MLCPKPLSPAHTAQSLPDLSVPGAASETAFSHRTVAAQRRRGARWGGGRRHCVRIETLLLISADSSSLCNVYRAPQVSLLTLRPPPVCRKYPAFSARLKPRVPPRLRLTDRHTYTAVRVKPGSQRTLVTSSAVISALMWDYYIDSAWGSAILIQSGPTRLRINAWDIRFYSRQTRFDFKVLWPSFCVCLSPVLTR